MATPVTGTERPVRTRTPRTLLTWVAGSHSVSPDEQSGALPSYDTTSTANIDWTCRPTRPPAAPVSFAANNSDQHKAWITDLDDTTTATTIRLAWPVLIPVLGVTVTYLTAAHQGWPLVGVIALICVSVCAGLLTTAGAIQARTDHRRRSGKVQTGSKTR